MIQHIGEQLDYFQTDAAKAERKDICSKQYHRTHLRFRKRSTNTAGVTPDEINLQLLKFVGRDVDIGEFPETRADAVDDLTPRHDLLDHAPGRLDCGMGFGIDFDGLAINCHQGDLRQ
jgi:hypothetical protein